MEKSVLVSLNIDNTTESVKDIPILKEYKGIINKDASRLFFKYPHARKLGAILNTANFLVSLFYGHFEERFIAKGKEIVLEELKSCYNPGKGEQSRYAKYFTIPNDKGEMGEHVGWIEKAIDILNKRKESLSEYFLAGKENEEKTRAKKGMKYAMKYAIENAINSEKIEPNSGTTIGFDINDGIKGDGYLEDITLLAAKALMCKIKLIYVSADRKKMVYKKLADLHYDDHPLVFLYTPKLAYLLYKTPRLPASPKKSKEIASGLPIEPNPPRDDILVNRTIDMMDAFHEFLNELLTREEVKDTLEKIKGTVESFKKELWPSELKEKEKKIENVERVQNKLKSQDLFLSSTCTLCEKDMIKLPNGRYVDFLCLKNEMLESKTRELGYLKFRKWGKGNQELENKVINDILSKVDPELAAYLSIAEYTNSK